MDKQSPYYHPLKLLVKVLPHVFEEEIFALKGGTAINLFFRNMPRISVDIDMVYLPIQGPEESLDAIDKGWELIAQRLRAQLEKCEITKPINKEGHIGKIFVSDEVTSIKIEVNHIIRGSVNKVMNKPLCEHAQDEFDTALEVPCFSFEDVYAGKICAALDRQHPWDLFDIKILMETEGITEALRRQFIVYLISHSRPISEVIAPRELDITDVFEKEFVGMPHITLSLEELIKYRTELIKQTNARFTDLEKEFLISFKEGSPRWDLLEMEGVEHLPSVKWKLLNIQKMDSIKRERALKELMEKLNMDFAEEVRN